MQTKLSDFPQCRSCRLFHNSLAPVRLEKTMLAKRAKTATTTSSSTRVKALERFLLQSFLRIISVDQSLVDLGIIP